MRKENDFLFGHFQPSVYFLKSLDYLVEDRKKIKFTTGGHTIQTAISASSSDIMAVKEI